MMGNNQIRLLRADEIECRTGIIREHGLSLLLYKDARVDQNILDETFGIFGWKREHQILDGKVFCTISVKDDNGEWIPKQDVGTESFSEPTKGAASDSFKRAAFNIGIGRELYTAPFIWLSSDIVRIERHKERFITKDSFYVSEIRYNEDFRSISGLRICNQKHQVVYHYGAGTADQKAGFPTGGKNSDVSGTKNCREKDCPITAGQLSELLRELARTGVAQSLVLQRYGIMALKDMDQETFFRAMSALQKTPAAA